MPTKLSRYSEAVMEAAWLAAVVVVPVFFNVYSNRIFEPDKLALLRTLALVTLAAWIVKLAEGGRQAGRPSPEGDGRLKSQLRALLRFPLLAPVAALAVLYGVATIFSVTPATSLWGSYQRLQGTYTTFSYLVFFAALLANLRRRAQVERLISAVIVSSLPVSLYGVLQRYQIDPVPWGGNVTVRIAANMGNSIFVAAYLIMVSPLTMLRIVQSFIGILNDREGLLANFARGTAYVFIAALQVIALVFSGSRGPLLGWLAGSFFLFLVLSLLWRQRWVTVSLVGVTLALAAFLVLLNVPGGPFERIRTTPGIGRLGQLLDPESTTGKVRVYIWKGAAELVLPHAPLEYPDGRTDPFNFLRPLIGYGPESLYVTYNRFYQPELTTVEKRNASPDRSHNETWDSLAFTGLLGLAIYLVLFGSIFYYGLKWLGLIPGARQRSLFLLLYLGGGALSAAGFVLWKGAGFFGVGLPFGMIIGVIVYLMLISLFGKFAAPRTAEERSNELVLLALLAVIVGHFVEINFGIAIAVTRVYFWTFTALLLLVGFVLPRAQAEEGAATPEEEPAGEVEERVKAPGRPASAPRKKRKGTPGPARALAAGGPAWLPEALVSGGILAILLITLGYDFVNIGQATGSAVRTIWDSLVRLGGNTPGTSYGVLAMVASAWLMGGVVFASEGDRAGGNRAWLRRLGAVLGISLAVGLLYWLWHAAALAVIFRTTPSTLEEVLVKVAQYEGLLARYYIFLLLLVLGLALSLAYRSLGRARPATRYGLVLAPALLLAAVGLSAYTNLRIVQADIAFKLADPFTRSNSWAAAITIYNRANQLAPAEDYYYLFLGRAYLESAKSLSDAAQRDELIQQAERDLKKAQEINPLNTDHTANLARLYSLWASLTEEGPLRESRAQLSDQQFARAVSLSPNNSRIWDEWALLYLNIFRQPEEARQRLDHSLEIDPQYDFTQALMAEYLLQRAEGESDPQARTRAYEEAAGYYRAAVGRTSDIASKMSYLTSLAQLYIDLARPQEAIATVQEAIQLSPQDGNRWRYEHTLAQLYLETGDRLAALEHANQALALAPADQQPAVQSLITQLQSTP